MQKEWIQNAEVGFLTIVLIWDLSAAFDMVNAEILFEIYIHT